MGETVIYRTPKQSIVYFERGIWFLKDRPTTGFLYRYEFHDHERSVIVEGNDRHEVYWQLASQAWNLSYFMFRMLGHPPIKGKEAEDACIEAWLQKRKSSV